MELMEFLHELKPQFDTQKSFYKKANVYRNDKGKIFLKSYETIVAEITDKTMTTSGQDELRVYDWYSNTTTRHVNEFAQQYGFSKMNKKEMERGEVICKK